MESGELTGVPLSEAVLAMDLFAPAHLACDWDNTGLLVEPYTHRNICKILMTNDLTEDVVLEADGLGCEMIVSYHPPIFTKLNSVVQSSWKERIVSLLLERRIALYSPHTRWDSVRGGVNDWLASIFPQASCAPILPNSEGSTTGPGRILQLKEKMTISEALTEVKRLTGQSHIRLALGKGKVLNSVIDYVALCAGSGWSVLKSAKADVYLAGEMTHHDILDATQRGTSVILTNHSNSERGFLKMFSSTLKSRLDNNVDVMLSELDRDPILTF